jgi:hypothetical protein
MTNLSFLTEAELLETFRISLENVRNQSDIACIMAEFGYPIAKVVFRNDPAIKMQLALNGEIPAAYLNWLEFVRKLYQELAQNTELQAKVAPLKLTQEKIVEATNLISLVESSRADYIRELGESQQSKVQKDYAIAQLETWMREFYAVAKIALEDKEGLLKAIRN